MRRGGAHRARRARRDPCRGRAGPCERVAYRPVHGPCLRLPPDPRRVRWAGDLLRGVRPGARPPRPRAPLLRVPPRRRRRRAASRTCTPSTPTWSSSSARRSSPPGRCTGCAPAPSASSPSRCRASSAARRCTRTSSAGAGSSATSTRRTSTASSPSTRTSRRPRTTSCRCGGRCRCRSPTATSRRCPCRPRPPSGRGPLFVGRSTPHRELLLAETKHHFDLLHLAFGVDADELAEALATHDVGINLHNNPYPSFENRVCLHLAAGHLVLSESLHPAHGLEPGIDFVVVQTLGRAAQRARQPAALPRPVAPRPRPRAAQGRAVPGLARLPPPAARPARRPRRVRDRPRGLNPIPPRNPCPTASSCSRPGSTARCSSSRRSSATSAASSARPTAATSSPALGHRGGDGAGQPLALGPRDRPRHALPDRRAARPSSSAARRGAIVDVVVDLRRGSPTFGEWEALRAHRREHAHGLRPRRLRARLLRDQRRRRRPLQAGPLLRRRDRARDQVRRPRRSGSSGRCPSPSSSPPSATRPRRRSPRSPTTCRSCTSNPGPCSCAGRPARRPAGRRAAACPGSRPS